MAEFCAPCTRDVMGVDPTLSEIRRGAEGDPLLWFLCEGCGLHTFDREGYPICGHRSRVGAYGEGCLACFQREQELRLEARQRPAT